MVLVGLKQVFRYPKYILLALTSGSLMFILATWLPNLGLVGQIVVSKSASIVDKVRVLGSLIGSISTNFTTLSALTTVAIAVLFGVNLAIVVYYYRVRRQLVSGPTGAVAGIGGVVSAIFGVGCAACGTFVLGPLISFVGATGLVALLPFGGTEFGVLAAGMLSLSLILAARKIGKPS